MNAVKGAADRSRPPSPGRIRDFTFPEIHHTRLDNGLGVLAARVPRVPLVSLQVLLPAGAQYEPLESPGLASLHGALLDEGTQDHSALEIAHRMESLGGSLISGAGWNMAYAEVGTLSQHRQAALEVLAEVIRSPEFPEAEIERLRRERLAEILRRSGQPTALAERVFAEVVYRGTVYGRPLIGTTESIERADRESLRSFYRRQIGPAGSTLIAVGDLDPEELIAPLSDAFGDWRQRAVPEAPSIEVPALAGTQVHIVDRPGSAQTQLELGHAFVPRHHPDYPQLLLLNTVFGGKFTSRINLNLREKHGYTYGAQSFFGRRSGPGPLVIRAAVATDVAGPAVGELMFEMRRIREEPVSREELQDTRDYMIGVFPYTLQTIGGLVKRLEALVVFGLPFDYYDSYPAVFAEVDEDQVLQAAREHFDPDNLAIVAVGPAEDLRPQLEGLGPVTVHQP